MPPLPKSSRRPSTGKRERDAGSGSSSTPPTAGAPRSRTTKAESLQSQIARFYIMVGTALRPFGRFYPVLAPVGDQFRELAQEAADSWIELGQKDKRILEVWESLTGASAWGNVIGIHFAIFAAAIPGGEYFQQMQSGDDQPTNMREAFYVQGKAMGLDDDEIEQAIAQAMGTPMPARDTGSGGPGDSVKAQAPPKHDGSPQATATAAPPVAQSRAAIVTPQQLGVTQVGLDGSFPADAAPPNGTGVISE